MAYTNIGLCFLVVVLIVLVIIMINTLVNIDRNTDTNNMAIYELERELKDIKSKLNKKD